MHAIKYLFNVFNYGFYCLYSFTLIDVVKKITFGEFYLSNATNFVQFLLTLVGLAFAFFKLKTYIRDSRTRSKMLEQELIEKQNNHFYKRWTHEFLEPKIDNKDEPTGKI